MGERVLHAAREMAIFEKETRIPVTVSVGVAELSGYKEVEAWVDSSDKALYRAKQTGRDRVVAASRGV
jgi:diguanylate cyclase (GGDEF)-like protein